MTVPLKLWNGAADSFGHKNATVYCAAHSRNDLLTMIKEWFGHLPAGIEKEIRMHWGVSWGPDMAESPHERGIWIGNDQGKLEQVYPVQSTAQPA